MLSLKVLVVALLQSASALQLSAVGGAPAIAAPVVSRTSDAISSAPPPSPLLSLPPPALDWPQHSSSRAPARRPRNL